MIKAKITAHQKYKEYIIRIVSVRFFAEANQREDKMNNTAFNLTPCFIVLIPIALICILAVYINIMKTFSDERRYIKLEIRRASHKSDRRYWKRELRKLYISYIPIIGKKLLKHMDN